MNRFSLSQMANLPRLANLIMPSYRDFYPEKLIIEIGLYEAVLIDAADVQVFDNMLGEVPPHLEVSRDIAALHRFMNFNNRVMLPCPDCKQNQPFELKPFINPRKVAVYSPKPTIVYRKTPEDDREIHHNVFNPPKVPEYIVGNDFLDTFNQTEFQNVDFSDYKYRCALSCVNGIAEQVDEIRRDFYCTFSNLHRGFVNFIIYEAVDRYTPPKILQQYENRKKSDPTTKMTTDEIKAKELYERLKTCLIMEKVGQYPSMADLQMFDIEKYKTVLNREAFRDFKTALGLYASGVGCGSFVYLRRIFEGLVAEAESTASAMDNWDAEEFMKRDFNKKIEYLESFGLMLIPDELKMVKTKIYGILSRGVHASSDQECIELFPAMKYVIEELLDHKIAEKEHEAKLKKLTSVLGGKV